MRAIRGTLWSDLFRAVAILTVCLLIGLVFFFNVVNSLTILRHLHFNDFGKFYYSTQAFEQGRGMYSPSPATSIPVLQRGRFEFLDMNPPQFHALLLPLVHMPIGRAFAVWVAISCCCLAASVLVVAREVPQEWTLLGGLWTLLFACSFTPTIATMVTGQLTFILLLPTTLAWRAARNGSWRRAGIVLGILVSIKPFLGVFAIYFAWTRRWSELWWMAAACAASFLIGAAIFGPAAYRDWIGALRSVTWAWAAMNASLQGLLTRALDGGPVFEPIIRSPRLIAPLSASLSLALGITTFKRIDRDGTRNSVDRDFTALLLLAILASPLGWAYYLWLPAGPAAALWFESASARADRRDLLVALALPGLFFPLAATVRLAQHKWAGITLGSIYSWSVVLLWLAVIADYAASRTPAVLES